MSVQVAYEFGGGAVRFYLAPKISEYPASFIVRFSSNEIVSFTANRRTIEECWIHGLCYSRSVIVQNQYGLSFSSLILSSSILWYCRLAGPPVV